METEVLDEFVVAGCRRDISPTVKLRSDGQRRPEDVERRLSVDGNDCLAPFLCESRAAGRHRHVQRCAACVFAQHGVAGVGGDGLGRVHRDGVPGGVMCART